MEIGRITTSLKFIFLAFFLLIFNLGLAQKRYAGPNGLEQNQGLAASNPISLSKAFSSSSPLVPGDTLVLLDGVYGGNFRIEISGTDKSPIVVLAENEGKAIIDPSIDRFDGTGITVVGSYIWLVNLHFTSSATEKRADLGNDVLYEAGVTVFGNDVKIINCWVYDLPGSGFQFWRPSLNLEVYGCVIFNNGSQSPVRGTGHGMYIQHNDVLNPKRILNNIIFQNASQGINIFTTDPPNGGINVLGNIFFNTGVIANYNPILFRPPHNFSVGSENNLSFNVEASENIFYTDLQSGRLQMNQVSNVTLGRSFQPNKDLIFKNNLLVGGRNQLEIQPLTGLEFTGNKFFNLHGKFIQFLSIPESTNNIIWDRNIYYNGSTDPLSFSGLDFQTWKSSTNLDLQSQLINEISKETQVKITQNSYQQDKFYISIYNPNRSKQVDIDFSTFNIPEGTPYKIIDIQNPFDQNTRVLGQLIDQRVTFKMDNKISLAPKGNMPYKPVHTDETFAVFQITFDLVSRENPSSPDFKSSFQVALNSEGFIITSISDFFNSPLENDWEVSLSRSEIFSCNDLGIQKVTVTVKNSSGHEWSQEVSVEVFDNLAPDFEATDAYLAFDKTIGTVSLSPIDFYIQEQFIYENCLGLGGVSVDLDRTTLTCNDLTGEPVLVKITMTDKSGNMTTKTRKVFLNPIESKKVSLKSSGNLIEGETVTLTLGAELEYEVAYWKKIGSSGLETFPDIRSKSLEVDKPGQYVAVLNLASGCEVESDWIVVELTNTNWPNAKENIILNLSENGNASLIPSNVFETWPVEGVSVSFSKSGFSCENLGKNQVTATLTHPVWGEKQLSLEVEVVDQIAPSLSVKTPALVLDRIIGFLEVDVQDFVLSATDNCEVSSLEISPSRITCVQIGKEVTFEIAAKDPAGNQTKKQVAVTIGESQSKSLSVTAVTSAPYYVGETVELRLGSDFEFAVEGWYRNGQLLTGQKGKSILAEQSGSYFAKVFPTNGCLINSDAIQVNFQEAEFGVIRPEILLNLGPNGQAELQSSQIFETWPLPTGFTATLSQSKFTCEDLGENEVTILIKNDKGTTWERKTMVVVRDTIAPVLKGSANEVFLDVTQGNLELDIDELITEVSDNCGIKEISPSKITLNCEDLAKTKEVKISAVDFSGNKTEIIVPLTVKRKEETAPVLEGLKEFCEGEASTLEVKTDGNFEVIAWRKNGSTINGETQKILSVTESGEYQALIRYTGGCLSETETVSIQVNPLPVGEIQVDGNILRAPEGFTYQWYRNGEVMSGKTDRTLIVDSMGEYKVLLKSESGCEAFLNSVTLTISGIALPWTSQAAQLKIYPNPAKDVATLEFVDEPTPNLDALKIYTATGADITDLVQISSLESGKLELRFSGIASGTYLLTWIESGKKAHFGRLIILK